MLTLTQNFFRRLTIPRARHIITKPTIKICRHQCPLEESQQHSSRRSGQQFTGDLPQHPPPPCVPRLARQLVATEQRAHAVRHQSEGSTTFEEFAHPSFHRIELSSLLVIGITRAVVRQG